jgi:hypothetical protein
MQKEINIKRVCVNIGISLSLVFYNESFFDSMGSTSCNFKSIIY